MSNTAPTSGAVAWQRIGMVTGVAGLAAVVLIFVVLVGTRQEPPFTAAADEFLTHYRSPNTVASDFRSFAFTIALVGFVWFVVALSILLRRAEGETRFLTRWVGWLAIASGVGLVLSRISWTNYISLLPHLSARCGCSRSPGCSFEATSAASPNPVDPCRSGSCLAGVAVADEPSRCPSAHRHEGANADKVRML